jgi:hypothetical protein
MLSCDRIVLGLVATTLGGVAILVFGIWVRGVAGWLSVIAGAALIGGAGYWLIRNAPRLTLSDTGIEWGFEWSIRRLA